MSTDLSLERAIQALRTGDRETGRALLQQLTQTEPQRPDGWLWLAAAQDDPIQKRACLQQVIALDPGNQRAVAGLRALDQQSGGAPAALPTVPSQSIPEQTPVKSPAATIAPQRLAPPRFTTTGKRARKISWPIIALVGALVILIPLALWLLGQAQSAQAATGTWATVLIGVQTTLTWQIDVEQPGQTDNPET